MPARPNAPEGLQAIAQQVIADNPELADQARKLINTLLKDVERTILIGDSAQKAVYVKAILPGLLRAMQDREAEGDGELKAAFDRVMSAVRGG